MSPNPVLIFYPSPGFGADSANRIREDIQDALATGIKTFLINFQEVEFMDRTGLETLLAILKNIQTAQGQLYLCSCNRSVQLLLELTGTYRVFSVFADQVEFQEKVVGG